MHTHTHTTSPPQKPTHPQTPPPTHPTPHTPTHPCTYTHPHPHTSRPTHPTPHTITHTNTHPYTPSPHTHTSMLILLLISRNSRYVLKWRILAIPYKTQWKTRKPPTFISFVVSRRIVLKSFISFDCPRRPFTTISSSEMSNSLPKKVLIAVKFAFAISLAIQK